MEQYQELRELSKKKIKVADHMLTMTYPLVQDSKLLLAVVENIFLALSNAMGSVLYYERLFKMIPPFQEDFSSKFNMFRSRIVDKHKIKQEYIDLIQDIKNIIVEHKKSPVEFSRKDAFVICTSSYNMKVISTDVIKNYLNKAKLFIEEASKITNRGDEALNNALR